MFWNKDVIKRPCIALTAPKDGAQPVFAPNCPFLPDVDFDKVLDRVEAPFGVADLPQNEDVDLRIFIDKYLVEVFVNGRQAAVTAYMGCRGAGTALKMYCFAGRGGIPLNIPAKIRKVEIWRLKPANQGFMEAQSNRIWEPDTH